MSTMTTCGNPGRRGWGGGACRGWAVPPSSQILYKQTWVEEKEAAKAQLEEDLELPASADTLFLYQAFSGQLRTG